ncbi:MAG: hypothetical protein N2578_02320 [Bdellovibrionaceae bacterium]|nr:hypothetical protein [Pseudobdellovibrionaceae bacterium]
MKNRKGQVLIETVLLMALLVGVFVKFSEFVRNEGLLRKLVEEPWGKVAGMAEFGVWVNPETDRNAPQLSPYHFSNRPFTPKDRSWELQ